MAAGVIETWPRAWQDAWRDFSQRAGPHGYIHGWIKVGAGGGEIQSAQAYIAGLTGKIKPRELNEYDTAAFKRDVLDPSFHYDDEQKAAIGYYCGDGYTALNETARRGGYVGKSAAAISGAMQPMPEDLVLLREIKGAHALDHVQLGDIISDKGFSSTTLRAQKSYASGRPDTTIMHILTPKGTPAVWANPAAKFPEDEIILDRGQRFVVMRKTVRGGHPPVTDVYLLALPTGVGEPAKAAA